MRLMERRQFLGIYLETNEFRTIFGRTQ